VAAVTYGAEYLPANHFDTYFTAVQENGERILDKAVSLARKTVANVDPAMVRVRSRSYRCAPRERVAMKADGRLDVPQASRRPVQHASTHRIRRRAR